MVCSLFYQGSQAEET